MKELQETLYEDLSSLIKKMCAKWREVQLFVEKYNSATILPNNAVHIFYVNAMMHLRNFFR